MTNDATGADKIIAKIWPEEMPERERMILDGLVPEKRKLALARLEAVWRAENGEPLKPLADSLGLRRAAFFNLRRAWRERSLEGVIPNEHRSARRLSVEEGSPIRAATREMLLSAGPGGRNIDIAKRLIAAHPHTDDIGGTNEQTRLQAAERLVRDERKKLATDVEFLQRHFGQHIIIDLCAVAILLLGQRELAVVAVCLDAASGLVLGSSLNRLETASETQREAADNAWRFIYDNRLDRPVDAWPRCHLDMVVPPGIDEAKDRAALEAATESFSLHPSASYAFGREILQKVGPKMGRLSFAPRKTLGVDAAQFSKSRKITELPPSAAISHWEREVLRHNEPIIASLKEARIWGSGVSEGRMLATLEAVDAYLI
ncbi:hypothetical protein ABIE62_002946 [Porphyrobacter sp. MBR-155]|jgi:hypothetical protein|uniref:hypothetical protein n=1 Tax=Porphyrobacter sp. MBR-155 TaxID=3156464 RepID=UPI003395B4D4